MEFALVFVLAGAPLGGPPRDHPGDHWFRRDKALHFAASAVIQGVGHSVLSANGFRFRDAAWTAAGITMSIGVAKEIHDRYDGRYFSWKDLSADAAGTGAGAILMRQMDR